LNEPYQDYINRVTRLVLPATHQLLIQNIQHSPKFEKGKPVSFPGYSVITPPGEEDSINVDFYQQLTTVQEQLGQLLDPDLLVLLPPNSFHFTLADLIWDNSYRQAINENPEFEAQLNQQIQASFQSFQQNTTVNKPSTWQLLGLSIRPRAILVCLVPTDKESYQPIMQLRRSIYQNSALIGLGIEQQYDFTAHITLGYFGAIPEDLDRDHLCKIISQVNDNLNETLLTNQSPLLTVNRAELRKFDTMFDYYREPDWATLSW
jgi:hypothetical protein